MSYPNFKLLFVNNTPTNLELLISCLTEFNIQTFTAENGRSALDLLPRIQPDLVLLEVSMPGMEGIDVCKAIKANPATSSIAVIFLTAIDSVDYKLQAFAAGGVDYILQSMMAEEILARLRVHLHLAQIQRNLRNENARLSQQLAEQISHHQVQHELLPQNGSPVQLTLFDNFSLTVNGEERTHFRSDTVRALLAYLVLEGRTQVERAWLAEFFWPDYLSYTRLNSLRVALHNLRHLLAPFDALLVSSRRQVFFRMDPDLISCDAFVIEGVSPSLGRNAHENKEVNKAKPRFTFLNGFETVTSPHFQQWRYRKQEYFQLLLTEKS